jgi:hypothetical protein
MNKKVFSNKLKENVTDTHAKINWVYGFFIIKGFRCNDVKKSMIYLPPSE